MEAVALLIDPPVIHARLLNLDRSIARENLPRRMMSVAHHQAMATLIETPAVSLDVFLDFPLDRRLKRPAGAVAQNVVNHRHRCQMKLKCVTVHEAYPFCPAWDVVNRLHDSPKVRRFYSDASHPRLSVIAHSGITVGPIAS